MVNKEYLVIFHRTGRVLNTVAYTERRAGEQEEYYAAQHRGDRTKGTYWVHLEVKKYEASIMVECFCNFDLSVRNQ